MTTTIPTESEPRAGRREWIGLAVLALPTLLLSLDMSVLYLALPHLAADLQPSSSQLLWITDIYGFMIAGFLITMGTLGDRIGRRKLLMIGAAAFGVASVLAAYSTSAEMLIATRTLLGIAGATLMPSTLGLISNMFTDPKQRGVAISVWISCFMGGTAIGPVVGGLLLQWFWWGSAFLLGVPVMIVLLTTAPTLLPEHRDDTAGRLDLASVGLSLATILPIIYGLKDLAKDGASMGATASVAVGAAVGVVFVRRQLRLSSPLLDLRLFANRTFSTALGVMMLGAVAMGGMFLFVSQYLQLVEGLTPLRAGLWLVPPALGMITGTLLAPQLAQRIGAGTVIGGGMIVTAVGFVLLTQADAVGGLVTAVIGLAIAMVGLGPGAALVTDIVVGSAPPEKAGSAAAMSETSGEFGIAMGIAGLGSLGSVIYRDTLTVPAGTPPEAAAASHDTLAGAVAAAEQLPAELAGPLLTAARGAFTDGLHVVAGFGAVVMVVVGTVTLMLLRKQDAPAQPSEAAQPSETAEPVAAVTGSEPTPVAVVEQA
ncbi:DHA2 family multidrug resistance protein-like MFS transporter [Haloactinopolyspora alba]|uniref:DHA2 family multidrug resistance protein-like MFS transporter n=1 Tax=Haloactinopolyspora alba TaxID=648780 RepID=A0A2P8DZ46_9ACTN|nr:MFS transporter [Haloactinopolyspora alba]PSL02490.1 DHA2 family multidrug resistance protein-like MFS transporter [Haloactinopolyspora alba]